LKLKSRPVCGLWNDVYIRVDGLSPLEQDWE
ncbi:unnamed protein product, partial [marine sediment metagenome]